MSEALRESLRLEGPDAEKQVSLRLPAEKVRLLKRACRRAGMAQGAFIEAAIVEKATTLAAPSAPAGWSIEEKIFACSIRMLHMLAHRLPRADQGVLDAIEKAVRRDFERHGLRHAPQEPSRPRAE